MVAPERQRQGLGEVLFRTWDRHVGASLGLGLSESSHRLFQKLRWPDVGPVPCLVKPLTPPRAAPAELARAGQPARVGGDAADREDRVADAAAARRSAADPALRRQLHARCGTSWRRSSTSPSAATRAYLNWKYIDAPHVRYTHRGAAPRRRERRLRRLPAPARAARPGDAARRLPRRSGRRGRRCRRCCAGSIAKRAQADSDKIRTFAMHAGFRQRAQALRLLPGEIDDGVRRQGERRRRAAGFYEDDRPLARHARRLRPGSMTRHRVRHAPARRHRHRRRQPVGRGGAREPDVREHLRAPEAARALRAPRRPADLRRHATRSRPTRARPRCCARCSRGGDCEIGAHHHAWETPPCTAEDVARHPYASTLPRDQFEQQLASLTERDRGRGRRARRCRIDRADSASRRRTSPRSSGTAIWSNRASRRSSTSRTRADRTSSKRRSRPYFLAYDSATRPGTSNVLEVPVSAAL